MEAGATGQVGVAVLRRAEKEQRSGREHATILLPLTVERSVLVDGPTK